MKSMRPMLVCSIALLPAINANASVKEANRDFFDVDLSADYKTTDNAKKQDVSFSPIDETQEIYRANLNAHYQDENLRILSDYSAQREIYQQQSEPDATRVLGHSLLELGNDYQPFGLLLLHDRTAFLVSPDAADLTINSDTREMLTLEPSVKKHMGTADSLVLTGSFTNISFQQEAQKNNDQKGVKAAWIHGLDQAENLTFSVQDMKSAFEFVPSADYRIELADAQYQVKLRRLEYSIEVGYNKATTINTSRDFSSPTYKIESSYDSGFNKIGVSLVQLIGDSSTVGSDSSGFGTANQTFTSSKGVGVDLINSRTASVNWLTRMLNERCTFGANVAQSVLSYQNLSEDGHRSTVGASFNYKLTRSSSINYRVDYQNQTFSADTGHTNFNNTRQRLSYNYLVTKGVDFDAYLQKESKNSVLILNRYVENIAGIKLSYHF